MHAAHLQWLAEHDAITAVLQGILSVATRLSEERHPTDFAAMRAMLVYLGDYPEIVHHPREESTFFVPLSGRDPALDVCIAELRGQHETSLEGVMRIEHQLNRAEFGQGHELDRLRTECDRFVVQYLAHIEIEERDVMDRAEDLLSEQQWDAIAAELARRRDPLAGLPRDCDFERLYAAIARLAPAPAGLGHDR